MKTLPEFQNRFTTTVDTIFDTIYFHIQGLSNQILILHNGLIVKDLKCDEFKLIDNIDACKLNVGVNLFTIICTTYQEEYRSIGAVYLKDKAFSSDIGNGEFVRREIFNWNQANHGKYNLKGGVYFTKNIVVNYFSDIAHLDYKSNPHKQIEIPEKVVK